MRVSPCVKRVCVCMDMCKLSECACVCVCYSAHSLLLGLLDGGDLLSDDRQHLHIDAVELIETGPRPRAAGGGGG